MHEKQLWANGAPSIDNFSSSWSLKIKTSDPYKMLMTHTWNCLLSMIVKYHLTDATFSTFHSSQLTGGSWEGVGLLLKLEGGKFKNLRAYWALLVNQCLQTMKNYLVIISYGLLQCRKLSPINQLLKLWVIRECCHDEVSCILKKANQHHLGHQDT